MLLLSVPQANLYKTLQVGGNEVQVKWRAELRERELERMSGLEGEWRRREAARTAELAKIKAHYAHLDTQTRQAGCTSLLGSSHCRGQRRGGCCRVEGEGLQGGGEGGPEGCKLLWALESVSQNPASVHVLTDSLGYPKLHPPKWHSPSFCGCCSCLYILDLKSTLENCESDCSPDKKEDMQMQTVPLDQPFLATAKFDVVWCIL